MYFIKNVKSTNNNNNNNNKVVSESQKIEHFISLNDYFFSFLTFTMSCILAFFKYKKIMQEMNNLLHYQRVLFMY